MRRERARGGSRVGSHRSIASVASIGRIDRSHRSVDRIDRIDRVIDIRSVDSRDRLGRRRRSRNVTLADRGYSGVTSGLVTGHDSIHMSRLTHSRTGRDACAHRPTDGMTDDDRPCVTRREYTASRDRDGRSSVRSVGRRPTARDETARETSARAASDARGERRARRETTTTVDRRCARRTTGCARARERDLGRRAVDGERLRIHTRRVGRRRGESWARDARGGNRARDVARSWSARGERVDACVEEKARDARDRSRCARARRAWVSANARERRDVETTRVEARGGRARAAGVFDADR
jgi:hypothetical protein